MLFSVLRSWLSFAFLLPLFEMAFAEISITYPTNDTVYPPTGPDAIGWTFADGDPSNVTIYLATYNGDTLINNLYGLVWATESESVEITFKYPPVPGETYTWMFYDTTQAVDLDKNFIAQSAHFRVQNSSTSTSAPTTTTGSSTSSTSASATKTGSGTVTTPPTQQGNHGLSYGAVAAIGVVTTLLVVALCLFGAFLWFRKRLYWKNKGGDVPVFGKPELEGKEGAHSPALPRTEPSHDPENPPRTTVAGPGGGESTSSSSHREGAASPQALTTQPIFARREGEVLPPTAYEMHSNSQQPNPPELGGYSAPGIIHRKGLYVIDRGQVEHSPNELQDGRTLSPQIPQSSNAGPEAATREPLPPSHQ